MVAGYKAFEPCGAFSRFGKIKINAPMNTIIMCLKKIISWFGKMTAPLCATNNGFPIDVWSSTNQQESSSSSSYYNWLGDFSSSDWIGQIYTYCQCSSDR